MLWNKSWSLKSKLFDLLANIFATYLLVNYWNLYLYECLITERLKLQFYIKESKQSILREEWYCVVKSYNNLKWLIGLFKKSCDFIYEYSLSKQVNLWTDARTKESRILIGFMTNVNNKLSSYQVKNLWSECKCEGECKNN